MSISRYDNERLRAIEERLRDEDPDYVRRLERSAGDLPEVAAPADDDIAPTPTFVLVCVWVFGALVFLLLMAATADLANEDFAGGPRGAPSPPASEATTAHDSGVR